MAANHDDIESPIIRLMRKRHPELYGQDRAPREYRPIDLADFLIHEFPPREYVLKPILYLGSLSMVYAWRGVGKTHFALGMAYAAASGGKFLGWTASRPFRVLYLDGEMPGLAMQERMAAIVAANEAHPPPGYFQLLTIDLCDGVMPDLATREGQALLGEACDAAEVIVVDNLSCLVRGSGKENDAESWLLAAEWALNLRSRGKSVIFVHHAGKNGEQRGTSKREDQLDLSISLKRPPNYRPEDGARFVVDFVKGRHLSGNDAQSIEVALDLDRHGKQVWTSSPVSESTFERVVELLEIGMNQKDIAEELGINRSTVCRHYQKAVDTGRIKSNSKKPQNQTRWRRDLDD